DNEQTIEFGAAGFLYKCTLADYHCTKGGAVPAPAVGGRGGAPEADSPEEDGLLSPPFLPDVNAVDRIDYEPPAPSPQEASGGRLGRGPQPCGTRVQASQGKGRGGRGGRGAGAGRGAAQAAADETPVCTSFDGKWDAYIQNFNVFLRLDGSRAP